mmetsp:Transcript_43311/g.112597  ORF Transcript_43311/g.112597 Transcript_43311/m.112597 type:complete len:202 (+) Transcript_43311:3111-3716(+)
MRRFGGGLFRFLFGPYRFFFSSFPFLCALHRVLFPLFRFLFCLHHRLFCSLFRLRFFLNIIPLGVGYRKKGLTHMNIHLCLYALSELTLSGTVFPPQPRPLGRGGRSGNWLLFRCLLFLILFGKTIQQTVSIDPRNILGQTLFQYGGWGACWANIRVFAKIANAFLLQRTHAHESNSSRWGSRSGSQRSGTMTLWRTARFL